MNEKKQNPKLYNTIHHWVSYNLGKAKKCQNKKCKKISKFFDWAILPKKSHWDRNLKHYIQLCRSCHTRMDRCGEKVIHKTNKTTCDSIKTLKTKTK